MPFDEFFRRGSGHHPFPYQRKLAETDCTGPVALAASTGSGKTLAVLAAWLWRRRFHEDPTVRASTPRRLVYCLPMRVLVEQTIEVARTFLEQLDLPEIGVHALLGGAVDDAWADHPAKETVLVGTQDMLLSRALNRGYAASRFRWPRLFGLLHNDALWVCDEVQLMGPGLATALQLDAFRRREGCFGLSSTLLLSATLDRDWLETVDSAAERIEFLALGEGDLADPVLSPRMHAVKRIERVEVISARALAGAVAESHQPGATTLVVVNRVKRAVKTFKTLQRLAVAPCVLLHSRFRRRDRVRALKLALAPPGERGRIVVATQVVEAGVDLDAEVLFTDLAPWSSLVQRLGRCNRKGLAACGAAYWIDLPDKQAPPYSAEELSRARERLNDLDGNGSPARLARQALDPLPAPRHVLRYRDLVDLFDTTPDIGGLDIDVGRYIREDPDRDLHIFWRDVEASPEPDLPAPTADEICRVPKGELAVYLDKRAAPAWCFDHLDGRWRRVRAHDLRPGMRVLLDAAQGGYDRTLGFAPGVRSKVPALPVEDSSASESLEADAACRARSWVKLAEHTEHVVAGIRALSSLAPEFRTELESAARWHDAGKAHPLFQAFLLKNSDPPPLNGIWAKSPGHGGRHVRPHFRHELASALVLLAGNPEADLAAYLAAAHHGKVRLGLRALPGEKPAPDERRYALGIWEGDEIPKCDLGGGVTCPTTRLDLELMELGGALPSWSDRMLRLLERLGPFRLSYLEALLRAADGCASHDEEIHDA